MSGKKSKDGKVSTGGFVFFSILFLGLVLLSYLLAHKDAKAEEPIEGVIEYLNYENNIIEEIIIDGTTYTSSNTVITVTDINSILESYNYRNKVVKYKHKVSEGVSLLFLY